MQYFAWHGCFENVWCAGYFGGPLADLVHLHVVAVAVPAVRLIAQQQVAPSAAKIVASRCAASSTSARANRTRPGGSG